MLVPTVLNRGPMLADLHLNPLFSGRMEGVWPDWDYVIFPFVSETAAEWMEREYESVFAVVEYAFLFHPGAPKYTFILMDETGEIRHVLLFEIRANKLCVLNSVCSMDSHAMEGFCEICFQSFPKVRLITFEKIRVQPEFGRLTCLVTEVSGDWVIRLPERAEQYPSIISKNLKKSINRLSNRVKRDFPDCSLEVFEKEHIPDALVGEIVRMNINRMRTIGKAPGHDEKELEKLVRLARKYGLVCCMRSGGEWLAGNINFLVGRRLYAYINGYNIKYPYYKLGTVCSFQSILHFIEKGIQEVHLLWGDYEYKGQLGAKKMPLYSFEVLRFPWIAPWRKALNLVKRFLERLRGTTLKRIFWKLNRRLAGKPIFL